MAELFKNIYNEQFINEYASILKKLNNEFDVASFNKNIFNSKWKQMELKERMRHISKTLNSHIKGDFKRQTTVLIDSITELKIIGRRETSIEFMFLPDFIEVFGIEDFKTSINTMEFITQFTSCEFAVRPFILKYPKAMINQMKVWSLHKHPMVRRLATEGCRPRLPWAMALPFLKKDPSPILPILETLKNDQSESVRRSVANNLNDISKDNPNIVYEIASRWKGKSKEIDWVVKHGCRTLLKQGTPKVMQLFGFGSTDLITVKNFQLLTPKVKIGGVLEFSFQLNNKSKNSTLIRLEYGIYYQKANGSLSKKVFKISEKSYAENSTTKIIRKQSFKIITTRKFHIGLHQVSIIINGQEVSLLDFNLTN